MIIAGGMITSLFTRRDINDVDIYFKRKSDLANLLYGEVNGSWIISHTDKAFSFKCGGKTVQAIYFRYFNNAYEIFETFDFTVCMGAYDFETEQFILHEDFLKHNSQRMLKFNSKTAYPLISALRVEKYKNKGYYISKLEFIRILLTILDSKISSYDELKQQMGGMYGENYDKIIEPKLGETFDISTIIEKLQSLSIDDQYYTLPGNIEISDWDEYIYNILGEKIKYFEHNGNKYRVVQGEIQNIKIKYDDTRYEKIDASEILSFPMTRYKYVKKLEDGRYISYYDNKYEWKIGENKPTNSQAGLFAVMGSNINFCTYYEKLDKALLELEVRDINDVKKIENLFYSQCEFNKVYVIREVPKSEYDNIVQKTDTIDDTKIIF